MPVRHPSSSAATGTQRPKPSAIFKEGLLKGWSGALWMYKILIPVSFLTFLLDASHLLDRLEGVLGPVMGLIHLPAKAAMPLVAGMLTGIYGGIAAMSVLSFTLKETTLIAVFLLISHALIQECAIQAKAGMHPLKAAALRLITSVIVVWIIGFFWQGGTETAAGLSVAAANKGFGGALMAWAWKTLVLSLQILAIIAAIMTAIVWMKATRMSERLAAALKPLLRFLGLSDRAGLLWLTAALFGISYGAAVIVEETRETTLDAEELERLHTSIGINHAMIEDPALFLPLGVHPLWLWGPRLVAAILAAHLLRLLRRRRRPALLGETTRA